MQQAITKDVALLALRIAGSIRRDEFYDLDDLTDYVNGFIDDYIDQEGLRLSKDELYQLRQEVVRMAKRRNTEIVESQWEEDDLDQVINNAIEDVSERLTVGRRKSGVARDPYGVSNDPQVVNAAINAERKQQEQTQRVVNPQPVGNGNTPKISQPAQTNPADAPDSNLDDRKKAAIQEKLRRYETQLSNKQPLNPDQTASYLNRLRQLRGFGAAKQAWDNDADGLLNGDGGDRFFKEHEQRRRQQQTTTQPQTYQTNQQSYTKQPTTAPLRLNQQDVRLMVGNPNQIQAFRQQSISRYGTARIADQEIERAATLLSYNDKQRVLETLRGIQQNRISVSTPNNNQVTNQRALVAPPKQYSKRQVNCNPAVSKPCGGVCIPLSHKCHEETSKLERVTAQLEAVPRALKEAQNLGKAMGLPVTNPDKPMQLVNAAAAFESQARQAMPFLGNDVWKGLSKATGVMVRASVVSSAVLGAWAAFKQAGGAINPEFKRALDMAENDALAGIQKMAGQALRPLTDPFEARMARQGSRLRSELAGMARQASQGMSGSGLRSAQTIGQVLQANQGADWYPRQQRFVDNQFAENFDGWLKESGRLATQPTQQAADSIASRRFAREFAGDIGLASLSREQMIDRADKATRSFADEIGSRMARLGKDPDALQPSDFMDLLPKRTLERFNPSTNSIESRSNDAFRRAVADSMHNRYQIGRRPATARRQELERQFDEASKQAKSELAGLNRFIQSAQTLKPGSGASQNRKAEGQQRERVVMALARSRGYSGSSVVGAYGFLREKHTKLPKRTDSLDRYDKKCGKSGIPDNAKCTKQTDPTQEEVEQQRRKALKRTAAQIGIYVAIFAALQYGPALIAKASTMVGGTDQKKLTQNFVNDSRFNPDPILKARPDATGSSNLRFLSSGLFGEAYLDTKEGVVYKRNRSTQSVINAAGQQLGGGGLGPDPILNYIAVSASRGGAKQNEAAAMIVAGNLGIAPKLLGIKDNVLAMEYLDGYKTLSDQEGSETQTREYRRAQARLLAALHVNGIAHNDAHINNVMVKVDPKTNRLTDTKLIDFGMASFDDWSRVKTEAFGLTSVLAAGDYSRQAKAETVMKEGLKKAKTNEDRRMVVAQFYSILMDDASIYQYVKPRTDAQDRLDKKCGNSGIPDNAKCSKPTALRVLGLANTGIAVAAGVAAATYMHKRGYSAGMTAAALVGGGLTTAALLVKGQEAINKARQKVGGFDPTKVTKDFSNDTRFQPEKLEGVTQANATERGFKYIGSGMYGEAYLDSRTNTVYKRQRPISEVQSGLEHFVGPMDTPQVHNLKESIKLSHQNEAAALLVAGDLGVAPKLMGIQKDIVGMEYLEGYTPAASYIGQTRKVKDVNITKARLLGVLHISGIAHNDTHNNNLMVKADPQTGAIQDAKLIDFGRASFDDWLKVSCEISRHATELRPRKGTAGYTEFSRYYDAIFETPPDKSRQNAIVNFYRHILGETHATPRRFDTQDRFDKKCGNSGIPDNAKCTKQTSPTQAQQPDSKPKAAAQPTSAVKPAAQQPAAKPTNTPNKLAAPSGPSSRAVATSVAIGAIGLAVGGAALFSHRQIQNPEVRQNFANLMVGAIGEVNKRDNQINEFIDQKLPDNMKEGARNLVGQTKVALNRVGLKAEGTELDSFKVDAEHNLFTYKAKTGEVMSITSVGTKVLAFQSSKSAGLSDHLKFPAYEMAFAVNYEVDSTKSGRTDRKEAIKIARQAQRMFEAQVAEIPDGTLISNVPYVEDGKGDERAKIYQRFGFDYLHESDRKATKGANAGRMWGIKQDGKLRLLTDLEKDRLRDMMVKLDSRSDAKAAKPLQMVVNVA